MDVVYLCRSGRNPELLYSLRSLRHLPHGRVWIYGDAPGWVNEATVTIHRIPRDGNKHRHTNKTLRAACLNPDISDPFALWNDDFYITEPIDTLPTYNLGPIRQVAAAYKRQGIHGDYVDGMYRTAIKLDMLGIDDPISFETHTPIIIHKQRMLEALDHGPYQRRSLYGNIAGLKGTTIRDVKINHFGTPRPQIPFLSTSDTSFRWMKEDLHRMNPHPSPYETP